MSSATKKFALATLSARSCAALAISVLAAGVVTVAPTGVAAASRGGASVFPAFNSFNNSGTTEQQPTSQTVRKPKQTTRGAAARAPKPKSLDPAVGGTINLPRVDPMGDGVWGGRLDDIINKNSNVKWIVQGR